MNLSKSQCIRVCYLIHEHKCRSCVQLLQEEFRVNLTKCDVRDELDSEALTHPNEATCAI